MHIPSDGPLDYQTVLAQTEKGGGVTVGGKGGRGWIEGARKREEKWLEKWGWGKDSTRGKKRYKGRENVVTKDTKTRKTNPSGGFPTPLHTLARSLRLSPILSQPGVEWAFTVQLCFLSKWSVNVKFSTKKKENKIPL